MRLRVFIILLLSLLLASALASADIVTFGTMYYVYPEDAAAVPNLTLSVQGETLDLSTFETMNDPLYTGAVFGVYMKNAQGAYVPYPDPEDPGKPYQLTAGATATSVALPTSVDLYIRQEKAAKGYLVGEEAAAYRKLSLPETIEYTNHQAGVQGLRVHLAGDAAEGPVPLANVVFTLQNEAHSLSLVTDSAGAATQLDVPPGRYTLRQVSAPAGYRIDQEEIPVTIEESRAIRIDIINSRDGVFSLSVMGEMVDGNFTVQQIPLDRRYEVFDGKGVSMGTLAGGETMALPASQTGISYTLRAVEAPSDGFAVDSNIYHFVMLSGGEVAVDVLVHSSMGFFTLLHLSAEDGSPVAGGSFALFDAYDNEVFAFQANAEGRYSPEMPLAPGQYILKMTQAAEGYQYPGADVYLEIEPYLLTEERPITRVEVKSPPIPEILLAPYVTAGIQALPSLFDEEARIAFTLRLLDGNAPLPISNLSFTFDLPDIPGLQVLGQWEDGAQVILARRIPFDDVQEVLALSVSGTVGYTFTYPISATATRDHRVEEAFTTTVATFAYSEKDHQFALRGHVTDQLTGDALSGLRVSLEDPSGAILYDETYTDPFGAYAFEQQPEGAVVRFKTEEGYGARLVNGHDAVVMPLEKYEGRVVAHGGLEGYPVELTYGDGLPQTPDGDGAFVFYGLFSDDDQLLADTPRGVLARVEYGVYEAIVHLYPAATLGGFLLDTDNTGIEGISITLAGVDGAWVSATDGEGTYAFTDLYPGAYTLTYTPPEGEYLLRGADSKQITLEAGERRRVDNIQYIRPATISGILVDGGSPVAGVPVTLSPLGLVTETGADGRFAFEQLYVGTYSLSLTLPADSLLRTPPDPINLVSPGERVNVALETVRPAQIAGHVFMDADDDGLLSPEEAGVAGAIVSALNEKGETVATTETGAGGNYLLDGLLPGSYRVSVTLPERMIFARGAPESEAFLAGVDGQTAVGEPITLASGQLAEGLYCGAVAAGRVAGTVWDDVNGNGMLDVAEPTLEGVEVVLLQNDQPVASVETGALGLYAFENLRTGDFTLRATLPDGFIYTVEHQSGPDAIGSGMPAVDARIGIRPVSIAAGAAEATINMGALRTVSIQARVIVDVDTQTTAEEAEGYQNIQVQLYTLEGQTLIAEAQTDARGEAAFAGLRPGSYQLRYLTPSADWGFSAGVTQMAGGWGYSDPVVFAAGETSQIAIASLTSLGSITGLVFVDSNYDGIRGQEEAFLSAKVTLLDPEGKLIDETQSNAEGGYVFGGLVTGNYVVRFELPEGYAFTWQQEEAPSFNSNVPETTERVSQTGSVFLPVGETLMIDAGAYLGGSVSGAVWHDTRGNGMYSSGNPPLAGLSVALMRGASFYAETYTAGDGAYSFSGLPPGDYAVRFTIPMEMYFTAQGEGEGRASLVIPTDGIVGTTSQFYVTMGRAVTGIDAGAVYTGSITGRAIDIRDNEGVAQAMVSIRQNGMSMGETVTNEEGVYTFEDIPAGQVEITFTPSPDWLLENEEDAVRTVTVPQRDTVTVDVRMLPQTVIEGFLWIDENFNGEYDEGELPLDTALILLLEHAQIAPEEEEEPEADADDGDDEAEEPGEETTPEPTPEITPEPAAEATPMVPTATAEPQRPADEMEGEAEEEEADPYGGEIVSMIGTKEDGTFRFEQLPPGHYSLVFTPPMGVMLYAGNETPTITLDIGESALYQVPAYVASYIMGTIWDDANGDGVRGGDEEGLESARAELLNEAGEVLLTRMTDAAGIFLFNELPPLTACTVRVTLPTGYVFSEPASGQENHFVEIGASTASTELITLEMNDARVGYDIGAMLPGSIGDLVWLDENGNGLQETDEPGVEGMEIALVRIKPNGQTEEAQRVTAAAGGWYRFENVLAGDYIMTFALGDTYIPTRTGGVLDILSSKLPQQAGATVSTDPFTVESGAVILNMDIGLVTREIAEGLGWSIQEDGRVVMQ